MTSQQKGEKKEQCNYRLITSISERVKDREDKLNNPQPSVIRGHCHSYATLSSFVLEDAAPPTPRRGQNGMGTALFE